MDYTVSDAHTTHAPTGQRLHQDTLPVATAWTAKDINSIIWSLMEVVKEAGLPGVQFDPDTPTSYRVLVEAIKAIQAAASSDLPGRVSIFLQPNPPPGWVRANGALLSRTVYSGLWAHVQTVGAVSDATWLAGQSGWFSAGDGATTFRVPDLRSVFIRGLDDGRGLDAGRVIGAFQAAANLAHTHNLTITSAADHIHNLTINNANAHSHGLVMDAVGDHTHNIDGGSSGSFQVGGGYGASMGSNGTDAATTDAAGGHTPSGTVQDGGIHSHTGQANAAGAHGHTGTADSSGGSDLRPINIALPFYIKY